MRIRAESENEGLYRIYSDEQNKSLNEFSSLENVAAALPSYYSVQSGLNNHTK